MSLIKGLRNNNQPEPEIVEDELLKNKPKHSKKTLRRRRWLAFLRFVKKAIPRVILVIFLYLMATSPIFRTGFFRAMTFVFRLAFAVMFILIQFIALFWFLARSKTEIIRPGDPKQLTFEDYKGQPRLVALVRQWLILLSDREQFTNMGGNFINGLLLYGPPGTGKTLLAKCMAGEADIAFISIEGSGFRAMFIGIDILKMVQFTNRAKKLAREYGAAIAFIDEIDAIGASRGNVMGNPGGPGHLGQMIDGMIMGGGMGGGSGALTRLLTVMDGIDEYTKWEKRRNKLYKLLGKPIPKRDWHVLYMGSTNRPDVLDPALTRPGRFDRMVQVDSPDKAGRREIIKYYLGKIAHDEIDIEALVNDTPGYTPAQIMAAITKGAVRIAIFDGRDKVNQGDIDRSLIEQAGGMENPIEEMPDDQRRQIAYHEAGHAVAIYHLRPGRRLTRATIVRHGRALGMVNSVNEVEQHARPLRDYVADIMVSMAGQVATKIFTGEPWTGASGGDYPSVRFYIWRLASEGYFGPPIVDPQGLLMQGAFGGEQFDRVWHRIEDFWTDTEEKVEQFLLEHREEVEAITESLLVHETLRGEELREIIQDTIARQYQNGHHEEFVEPEDDLSEIADAILEDSKKQPLRPEEEPEPVDYEPAAYKPESMDEASAESEDTEFGQD